MGGCFASSLTSTGTGVETQEGNTITFTVTPQSPVNANTTLVLNVQGQALGAVTSTTSAADFETTPAITFAQGDTAAKTITLKVATDTATEGREAYVANVIDTTAYAARSNTVSGVVTDKLPLLSLSQNVSSVNEGSTVTYTVTSDTAAPAGGFTVPFTVTGTNVSGTDYTALTASSITIAAGATTGSITVTTIADTATDGDKPLTVTLGDVTGATVSTTAKTVTTTVSDTSKALGTAEMTLTGATSVNEGSTVTYTVTLGANATTALSIPYTLTGTATSGTDFTGSTGTISVAAGSKTGTLTLTTVADSTTEGAETVTVTLGTVSGFTAASGQGSVQTTINDTSVTVTGSNLVLTTGVDNITGTSGNDTIVADNSGSTKQLSVADQINGGDGSDTLKVYLATGDTSTGVPSALTSIETFYVNGGAVTALTAPTGVTTLSIESPVTDTQATYTVAAGQAVILSDHTVTANKTTKIASSAATSHDITLNKITAATGFAHTLALTGANVTSATLRTTGTASKITLQNDSTGDGSGTAGVLATLTITGDKALTLTESLTQLKTINASAATAAVTVDTSGLGSDVLLNFTGGSGDDKLIFKAGQMLATDTVNGGTGTDTVQINDTTPVYAALNGYTSIEKLALGTTGATVDVSQLTTIRSFEVGTGNLTETFNNSTSTSTYKIVNDGNTGTVTVSNGVGQSTTTVNIDNQNAAAKTLAALTVSGETIINLSSTGVSGTAGNVITALNNADNSAITVTGAAPLTITNALAGTTTGSSFDASALTGALSVKGSAKNDVIKGGTANDTIQGATTDTANQADVLTGGAGADTFKFNGSTFANLLASSAGTTAVTKITDFVAGTDKIHLTNGAGAQSGITLANAQTITTAADLTAVYAGVTAISASTAQGATNGVVVTVSSGAAAGTYLYINDTTAGVSNTADMLINITGITGTLTANDFVFA